MGMAGWRDMWLEGWIDEVAVFRSTITVKNKITKKSSFLKQHACVYFCLRPLTTEKYSPFKFLSLTIKI